MNCRILPAALVVVAACTASADRSATLTIATDSSDRYPVLRSIGNAPVWRAEPVATITAPDSLTGEFGEVRSVLLAGDGTLYVVDSRYRAVSMFDSTGAYRGRLGRDGSGPGEYAIPYSLAWLGDSLALLDPGNSRIGLYGPDAKWLRTWPVQRFTGGQAVRLYRTPPDFWALASAMVGGESSTIFVRYGNAGARDTLPVVRSESGLISSVRCPVPRGITFFSVPFAPRFLVIPTPAGERAIARTSTYRVAFLGASGDTVRLIERTAQSAPIAESEWKDATADWDTFRQKNPGVRCDRDGLTRPAAKPPLAFMFYDHEGRLWVELTTPSGTRFDVFDEAGRLLATVEGLPSTSGIDPSVRNDRIALVQRDSLEATVVGLYRLRTAAR